MINEWIERKKMEKKGMEVVDIPEPKNNQAAFNTPQDIKPQKEGLGSRLHKGLTNLGERYKEHRAERKATAPQRQKMKMEKMKARTELLKVRGADRTVRMKQAEALGIQNPFGNTPMFGGPSLMKVPTVKKGQPHLGKAKVKKSKTKKKSTKKKSKGRSITVNY